VRFNFVGWKRAEEERQMRISRLEASVAPDTSPSDWPELANVNLSQWPEIHYPESKVLGGWSIWRGDVIRGEPASIEMVARGEPTDGLPEYYYMVQLPGEELGTLLGCLKAESAPEVIDAFLRIASPELLGAIAGRIIAHVATTASSRRGAAGG
jgi:hypothetical protein